MVTFELLTKNKKENSDRSSSVWRLSPSATPTLTFKAHLIVSKFIPVCHELYDQHALLRAQGVGEGLLKKSGAAECEELMNFRR